MSVASTRIDDLLYRGIFPANPEKPRKCYSLRSLQLARSIQLNCAASLTDIQRVLAGKGNPVLDKQVDRSVLCVCLNCSDMRRTTHSSGIQRDVLHVRLCGQ